jgi:hypothetical protein
MWGGGVTLYIEVRDRLHAAAALSLDKWLSANKGYEV